ncbi:type I-U CRISPR-associated helicase/endonuclease Cas3 [Rosistilla oblonga]|uniref:type I-G CRISPR-associated helicase/endonuclease Cas3g n=1 Tax=Rosistilla oblonga TaxID=2527990 RepID=UPI003A96D528
MTHDLNAQDFSEFFGAIYKDRSGEPLTPMPWQCELAAAACEGEWPGYISVPTGAGKTSSIDIAVFALAAQAHLPSEQRTAAMRTFLVVDRRTVVSEAYFRAIRLRDTLAKAENGILKNVADRLRSYTNAGADVSNASPLSVVEMRGGIYRDRNWFHSLTQPMIVTSTVDQVGSRLLFRGYGVAPPARPIQASAVAYDSLVILDEAHISPAFSQTLGYVRRYQQPPWTQVPLPRPLRTVEMTATPPPTTPLKKLEISDEEWANRSTHIGNIVNTEKQARLVVADKVKGGKAAIQLASVLAEQAEALLQSDLAADNRPRRVVGIMCNMVATAKETAKQLVKKKLADSEHVHLIIGAMRPIDRDHQTELLRTQIATGVERSQIGKTLFVVATQCIEVGADYDFDFLVTEAASLDSLVQRFGRLNRAGRTITSAGRIVMRGDYIRTESQLEADGRAFKTVDPIYGNSTSATWNWLSKIALDRCEANQFVKEVDFGIRTLKSQIDKLDPVHRERLLTATSNAPVLLPAHLDLLCQTSQAPWPDPDVSLWLHGPQRNDPEVQVCWRADLLPPAEKVDDDDDVLALSLAPFASEEQNRSLYQALSLCPPTSAECLAIPLRRVRSWLTSLAKDKRTEDDFSGDVASIVEEERIEPQNIPIGFRPVAWRGINHSQVISNVADIRPGDTLVFTPLAEGWDELGHLPEFAGVQLHDQNGNRLADRLKDPRLSSQLKVTCNAAEHREIAKIDLGSKAFSRSRNRAILRLHPNLVVDSASSSELFSVLQKRAAEFQWSKSDCYDFLNELPASVVEEFSNVNVRQLNFDFYSNRDGVVIFGPLRNQEDAIALGGDDETDDYSSLTAGSPVELSSHLKRVQTETEQTANRLSVPGQQKSLSRAAAIHDWGKADPRFQAMLLGGDAYTAIWDGALYAKSAAMPISLEERAEARQRAQLPAGFRHELLTLAFVETYSKSSNDAEDSDLLMHLIASHHGNARPWAPVCHDESPEAVCLESIQLPDLKLSTEQRKSFVYHRVSSSVPRRFWQLNKQYGWWGLAWLESILRISDQRVSRFESFKQSSNSAKD